MAKCPACKSTIEDGVLKCSNCKKELKWKDGEPVLTMGQVVFDLGKNLTIIGWSVLLMAVGYYFFKGLF